MSILLTGAGGQVGWELARALLAQTGVLLTPSRLELDLTDLDGMQRYLDLHRPRVIINPAAYTAVDQAEQESDVASCVNSDAPALLADYARRQQALLVHFSTDYVFDGHSSAPYRESDACVPLGVYGASKRAGELAILDSGCDALILRTSWVYAARGRNFLLTMLRLAASRERLTVVADQFGAPTWARVIADSTALILHQAERQRQAGTFKSGLYHLTCQDVTSWHGFAEAIIELARSLAPSPLLTHAVDPITTAEYPTAAPRPANSRLDCQKLKADYHLILPHWHHALRLCMADYYRN
ncbi:MAG: dTDP-4-dehydrorhamnose reductase [Methylococcales bacterium]|nr:dTDP-4-dehydrorhamnose reductase [Methylococcales bacterium]